MKRRPVRTYLAPAYPTRTELEPGARLLQGNTPTSWRQLEASLPGIVALLLTASTPGCTPEPSAQSPRTGTWTSSPDGSSAPAEGPMPTVSVAAPVSGPDSLPAAATGPLEPRVPDAMVVAPLFEHGEGRGATGCVVVAPPVFLSEQEALSIVREELGRLGIALGRKGLVLDEVHIAEQRASYDSRPGRPSGLVSAPIEGTGRPLELDAVAPTQHVAVEVVSRDSYFELGGAHSGSSVQGYDLKGVAASLVATLREEGKHPVYVGVFYDPAQSVDLRSLERPVNAEQIRAEQERLRAQSVAQLKAQVRDFASWLRGKAVL